MSSLHDQFPVMSRHIEHPVKQLDAVGGQWESLEVSSVRSVIFFSSEFWGPSILQAAHYCIARVSCFSLSAVCPPALSTCQPPTWTPRAGNWFILSLPPISPPPSYSPSPARPLSMSTTVSFNWYSQADHRCLPLLSPTSKSNPLVHKDHSPQGIYQH